MKTGLFVAYFASLLSSATVASAQESATDNPAPAAEPSSDASKDALRPPEEKRGNEHADAQFGHGMQFGLRAGLTGGYRMIFRYDKSPFCATPKPAPTADKDQQKFCGNGAPLAADVALSFGVLDFAEPYAWARFGFKGEASTNTKELLAFGAGVRIYTMSDSKFKIFIEPAVGVELEGGAGNPRWVFANTSPPGQRPEYKKDFLVHLAVGPQYDFARAFGVYLNAGLTTGILRYIHTQLELSGGVQVRVP